MDLSLFQMTLPDMIRTVGYAGVFLIVFIESGIPIGLVLPLPGDTLLFSGGILAAAGAFDLIPLMIAILLGAVAGDSAGYWFGEKFGTKLFRKEDAWLMNPRTLARAERFFARYGRRALIFARFIPVLRTVIPIGAGIARLPYRIFLAYNVVGAIIWTLLVTLLGYFLGSVIPDIDRYLLPILGVILVVSLLGIVAEVRRAKDA